MAVTTGRAEQPDTMSPAADVPDAIASALRRLEADGLVRQSDDGWRTTRRLQGAISRAATCLASTEPAAQEEGVDPERALALALIALYGAETPDALVADMIEALLTLTASASA